MVHRFLTPRRRAAVEHGQVLVEYGLILALIFLVALVAVAALGGSVQSMYSSFDTIVKAIQNAIGG